MDACVAHGKTMACMKLTVSCCIGSEWFMRTLDISMWRTYGKVEQHDVDDVEDQ